MNLIDSDKTLKLLSCLYICMYIYMYVYIYVYIYQQITTFICLYPLYGNHITYPPLFGDSPAKLDDGPLNIYITNWKDPHFLNGKINYVYDHFPVRKLLFYQRVFYGKSPACLMAKSTISTGPFSLANCQFTRGYTLTLYPMIFPSYQRPIASTTVGRQSPLVIIIITTTIDHY